MIPTDIKAGARLSDDSTKAWRLRQIVVDSYDRSKIGGFLYLFGWAVIAWLGGAIRFAPVATLVVGAGFLVLALLRYGLRPPPGGDADRSADRRWLRQFAWVLPLASMLWGGVQAWILLDGRFAPDIRMVSLIATMGYATVFANVYSIRRNVAAVGLCLLLVPALAVLWSHPPDRALAVAVSFYAVYVAGALLRTHADYRRRLDLDIALRQQRDLYEHLSRTDGLTGVYNRRHFAARLDQLAQRAQQGGTGFTLLILDIDHFKQVNDRFGHTVGDACLKALADRLQRAFASHPTLLARIGGEEFGVLFDGDPAAAFLAAEVLRHDLVKNPLECDGQRILVTASMGLGAFDGPAHGDGDGLYRAVDMALYQAKDQGRNRVQPLQSINA